MSVFSEKISIDLGGELGTIIEKMAIATNAKDATEVVRKALTLYHTIITEKECGNETVTMIKESDGLVKLVPIFFSLK